MIGRQISYISGTFSIYFRDTAIESKHGTSQGQPWKEKRKEVRHLLAIVHSVKRATTPTPVLLCNIVRLESVGFPFF